MSTLREKRKTAEIRKDRSIWRLHDEQEKPASVLLTGSPNFVLLAVPHGKSAKDSIISDESASVVCLREHGSN